MAIFWLIAVLGLFVLAALQSAIVDTRMVSTLRGLALAQAAAKRGLAFGMHPSVSRGDPLLAYESDEESYQVNITVEEARLNPNALIAANSGIVLTRLFVLWGMRADAATSLSAAIGDWIDADGTVALSGAEAEAYARAGRPGLPLNRPFTTLDEMRMVSGMDALEAQNPEWRDAFTLWTSGRINVNEANPEVISAACGIGLSRAKNAWSVLAGPDGIRHTPDDVRFTSTEEAARQLQIREPIPPLLSIEGQTRHVESIGRAGDFDCRLVMILSGTLPLYYSECPMEGSKSWMP